MLAPTKISKMEINYDKYKNTKRNVDRIEANLEKMGLPFSKIEDFVISKYGKEGMESYIISQINQLTKDISDSNKDYLEHLSIYEWDDIESKMMEDTDDIIKFLFHYQYLGAKDAYSNMFKNMTKIVSQPIYFFTALIDTLRLDFNVELFFCTHTFKGCKGFLFELEKGTSYKNKMGIVLTPLALKSVDTFFSTLFHELAHRLYHARLEFKEEKKEDIDHELNAYFADKFLLHFFKQDAGNLDWLDDILKIDLLKFSEEVLKKEPLFLTSIFEGHKQDIENLYLKYAKIYENNGNYYDLSEIENMYLRTKKISSVPRNYCVILDFLWFYSSRLSALCKMGIISIHRALFDQFLILIIYSKMYEKKFHTTEHATLNNVLIHFSGDIDSNEFSQIQSYSQFISENYERISRNN